MDNKVKITGVLSEKNNRLEEIKAKVARLQLKVDEMKNENQQQQSLVVSLQQQIGEYPANSLPSQFHVPSKIDHDDKTPVAATGTPKSCEDLRNNGHTANGLYLIMGTEQVETVNCDFTALPTDPSKIITDF